MNSKICMFMRKPLWGFSVCLGLFISSCQEETPDIALTNELGISEEVNGTLIPGEYIVVLHAQQANLRSKGSYAELQASLRQEVASIVSVFELSEDHVTKVYSHSIEGFSITMGEAEASLLKTDPRVKYVEQDRIIALAPPPGKGPNKDGDGDDGGSTEEILPYGVARVGGAVNYTGNNVAYVIDSGIDLDHPDLNVDASMGFNAITSGKDSQSLDDLNGHGTHVAGTIGAVDNNIGVIGVAAGAKVIPIKVLDRRGSGTLSGVLAGIDFVGGNGQVGDVANMSLGGSAYTILDEAVESAASGGVQFTIAAGNDGDDSNNYSPARANGPNIYTISAMDANDEFAYFSNHGNPPVDYCAPGVAIHSTWKNGGYNTISGTSMAAPHVAGILLLGNVQSSGTVNNDPDGNPDPIASH